MRLEYAEYHYNKFSSRLSGLWKTIKENDKRAQDDQEAFDLFAQNNPISYHSHKEYIQWQGSVSQRLLQEDISADRVQEYNKKDLSFLLVILVLMLLLLMRAPFVFAVVLVLLLLRASLVFAIVLVLLLLPSGTGL